MSSKRGFFITFESIDGAGKTTQARLLASALAAVGHNVLLRREPGASCIGAGIRTMLFVEPGLAAMRPDVADLLFLADHVQNAGDIADALEDSLVVVCDRWADSQFAYASAKGTSTWALSMYDTKYGPLPDLTVLFLPDDVQWALQRANTRRGPETGKQDAKPWNTIEAQERVQRAYVEQLVEQARTFVVPVTAADQPESIHKRVLDEATKRLGARS